MLESILNWVRRAAALVILVSLFLPFVTMRAACGGSRLYGGWEAIGEAPPLLSIPLFAVSVVLISFVPPRHIRTATGRLLGALLKSVWTTTAALWTLFSFHLLPERISVAAEQGGCMACLAWAAIFLCDTVESGVRLRAWRRWKREHPIFPLDDPVTHYVGWAFYATGGIPFLIATAWEQCMLVSGSGHDAEGALTVNMPVIAMAMWWALACLAGWGIRRGLYWALAVRVVASGASVALFILILAVLVGALPDLLRDLTARPDAFVVCAVASLVILGLWAMWNVGTAILLATWRRRLFPSRRLRLATPEGTRKVRVPCCPACGGRLWFDATESRLVCRPCGTSLAAEIRAEGLKVVDPAPATP